MAVAQIKDFERRTKRIVREHDRMAQGYVHRITSDGLVVARPVRRSRNISWTGFLILLCTLVVFKAVLFTSLGPSEYADRVDSLRIGTVIEKVGAWVMQPEPVTGWISKQISLYSRF